MTFKDKQDLANSVTGILRFAEDYGFELKKESVGVYKVLNQGLGGLHLFDGESGKFRDGWHNKSDDKGGNIVSFAKEYLNCGSWGEAYDLVLKHAGIDTNRDYEQKFNFKPKLHQQEPIKKDPMILPNKSTNNKDVFDYLTQTRGIDEDLTQRLLDRELVIQIETQKDGMVFKNCAFVSYDFEDKKKPKFCALRGIGKSNFKQDIKNSDKSYGFKMQGKGDKLLVFESPIDALSHVTLCKLYKVTHTDSRIATGGLNDKAVEMYLKHNDNIKEIIFCFDNDSDKEKNVGQIKANELCAKYEKLGFKVGKHTPEKKDFNEDLLQKQNSLKFKIEKANKTIESNANKTNDKQNTKKQRERL